MPNSLLGPLAGALADRVDQRGLMIAADVGRALVFVVMAALLPPFVALLTLFVVAAVLESVFRPSGRSAIPALVERDELMSANAWLVSALNVGAAIGPVIGGGLVAAVGVSGALYVNAATFLGSALLLIGLPSLRAEHEADRPGLLTTIREGLAFARTDPVTRVVVIGLFLGVAAASLDNVALVFMATRVFDAGPAGYGLLGTAFGVGMVGASLLFIKKRSVPAGSLFALGWFGTAVGNFGVGVAPEIAAAAAAQLIGGAGNGIGLVGGDTLVQESVPRHMMGRAHGVTGSAPFLGMLIAYGTGGFLVDAFGARATFLISGVATFVVAVFIWALLQRYPARD